MKKVLAEKTPEKGNIWDKCSRRVCCPNQERKGKKKNAWATTKGPEGNQADEGKTPPTS